MYHVIMYRLCCKTRVGGSDIPQEKEPKLDLSVFARNQDKRPYTGH